MNTVFKYNPYILEHHLTEISDAENELLIEQALDADNERRGDLNDNEYNVCMDITEETTKLNNLFVNTCHSLFDGLVMEKPKYREFSDGCAYVSNKSRYDSLWHQHLLTSTINGVYYARVPDDMGSLSIIDPEDAMEKKIIPLEKHLYLLPGWMLHKPNPPTSEEFRVSINIEYLSLKRPILKPDNWSKDEYDVFNRKTGSSLIW